MPVTNSFDAIKSGAGNFSRRWGATANASAVDPYITGYFWVRFTYMPDLTGYIRQSAYEGGKMYSDKSEIKNALASSCTSVTIPGGNVNKTDWQGLGGVKFGYPTYVEFDNTVSMRFNEWSGIPIYSIFHAWVKLIRDYRAGVSPKTGLTKSDFSATMLYWTCKPDGKSVDYYSAITGMFPLRDPADLFSHDITANDRLEIDMDFNADVVWREDWVYRLCSNYAEEYYKTCYNGINDFSSPVNTYGVNDTNSNSIL